MITGKQLLRGVALAMLLPLGALVGCQGAAPAVPAAQPLGALSDPIWQNQERNAEASDFVIYQHEFQENREFLNTAGEDHVKQLASRLLKGQDAKVVVERSDMSVRPDTRYEYPIHPNPELDMRRREIIVRSLAALGVADADNRVMVAPALTPGFKADEAERAYHSGRSGGGLDGASGGFGGFFFGGGIF